MVIEGGEVWWAEFFWLVSFQRFAYSSTTSSLMDKRRPQLDSAWSKGAKITFQGVLTVGGDGV